MRSLRTLFATLIFVVLLGLLSACIVELRPDNSMLIYLPPPAPNTPGTPNPAALPGTIPGTIPEPMARSLLEGTNAPVTTTITATTTLTTTIPPTQTEAPSATLTATVTATVTTTATQSVTATSSATARATNPASTPIAGTSTRVPTGTAGATASPTIIGTRANTPSPTSGATATVRATATQAPSSTSTATRQPTATATRSPTPTGGMPPVTATPIPSTVFVGKHQGFAADGSYFVVGEVLNGDAYPVFNVKVIGSFYDSGGNLVAAQESTTLFPQIEPELSSPFKLQVANSSGNIDHYELTLTWDDISVVDYEELAIVSAAEDRDSGEISGEVRNDGSVSVQAIVVVVTLYSAEGEVVNVIQGTVTQPVLGSNETTRYSIPIPTDTEYERFEVQAQGALKLF